MTGQALRVVLADDQLLLRAGVARLLEDAGMEVVAQSGDAEDLLRKTGAHRPHVVIVDMRMPPSHTDEGLRAAAEIRERVPGVGVLVLSGYVEEVSAVDLLAEAPTAWATCSRTVWPTSTASSTPCAASRTAGPPSTRRWSAGCSGAAAATIRSRRSARESATSSS